MIVEEDATGEGVVFAELAVDLDVAGSGGAVGEGSDAERIVIGHEELELGDAVFGGGLATGGDGGYEGGVGAEDAGGLACRGIEFHFAGLTSGGFGVFGDVVAGETERVERSVGASGKDDGMVGCGVVEFGSRGVALLLETGDEDLSEDDPVALGNDAGALADVGEYVGDGDHVGDLVIELVEGSVESVGVGIDQAREDGFAFEIDDFGLGATQTEDGGIGTDGGDAVASDGDGLGDAEA